jgi:hypothetical protein
MNKPITNGRVTRWLLLLQEFDITMLISLEKKMLLHISFLELSMMKKLIPLKILFQMNIYLQYLLTHCGMHILLTIWLQVSFQNISHQKKNRILSRKVQCTLGFKDISFALGQTS